MIECKTCAGEHDIEIHDATRSIHQWLRARLRRVLEPVPPPEPREVTPGLPGVSILTLRTAAARKRASRRCELAAKGTRGRK